MSEITIHLVHDADPVAPDAGWVADLQQQLDAEIRGRSLALTPKVVGTPDFAKCPAVAELDPLSVVVVVLPSPSRGFPRDEAEALRHFLRDCAEGDDRLIPLSLESSRDVPTTPLDELVSYKSPAPVSATEVTRLTNFLLIRIGLRQSGGQRAVFVSYRIKDGVNEATHLADRLRERGYRVWRDDLRDRDDLPMISPGSEAQGTIHRAILDHGFVLVVDTPEAPNSQWVHEEVNTAYEHMLPLLPVVIDDIVGGPNSRPRLGGRFGLLQAMQKEVRVRLADQQAKGSAVAAMDQAWLDDLETQMSAILLEHVRSRLGLLREAQNNFEAIRFKWTSLSPAHLLYQAELDRHRPSSPHMAIRLLVQCAPYAVLQEDLIVNLLNHFSASKVPCQYGVLVHPSPSNPGDKARLLRLSRGHLLLMTSAEIANLPALLAV